ncbi:hypothetical protein IU427_32630 [Nocardia beijingensis]|uniref:hypothetical protein n=1 Tax=Nocardia beijingensis TaxID=95162 RepID=UPI0018936CC6|nr:hypothetical protein [Nocardia beijingensis]MBF6469873.1 hypothetical protein [Nocardia beijingensis]
MPRPYPPEFRARAVALVRAGAAESAGFEFLDDDFPPGSGFPLDKLIWASLTARRASTVPGRSLRSPGGRRTGHAGAA